MNRPLGVSVMPLENRREALLHVATVADRLGYEAMVLPEAWSYDSTVLLAEMAARTERIRLGTAILGVWGRSAAQIAMAASTLWMVSGGRFVLGLGSSTAQLAEGLHDVPFGAPIRRLRQVTEQVRGLLRGERARLAVTTGARPLRINLAPVPELPIYLAALAPAAVRLAGEVADGWLPFLVPRSAIPDALALLREGAARSGNSERALGVWQAIPAVTARDAAEARRAADWFLTFYLTTMGPFYRSAIERRGFAAEVGAVAAADSAGRSPPVPAVPERLLDELVAYGNPADARARLERWREAGVTLPVVFLRPNLSREEIEFTLHAFREA